MNWIVQPHGVVEKKVGKHRIIKGLEALNTYMVQATSAVITLPNGYDDRLIKASESNARKALTGIKQDNAEEIEALLQLHPKLDVLVAQAARGLLNNFGEVTLRIRADEGGHLVLAIQTYDVESEVNEKLDAFEEEFWARHNEGEELLAITVDFLAKDGAQTD